MNDLNASTLSAYVPSEKTKKIVAATPTLLFVGPTGAGKDTMKNELLKTGQFHKIVTHTTRLPRKNRGVMETDGNPYHFVSLEKAMDMLKRKEFVEAAFVHSNIYGTSANEFLLTSNESKIALGDIDVQGVRSYRQLSRKVTAIFLLPPNFPIMLDRLYRRHGKIDGQQDINVRLVSALKELNEFIDQDFYYPIINDDLKVSVELAIKIATTKFKLTKSYIEKAKNLAKVLTDEINKYLAENFSTLDS